MNPKLKTGVYPIAVLLTVLTLLNGCGQKKETVFSGKTMGTTYQVKVVSGYFTSVAHLEKKIRMCLEGVNQSMSTYQKNSEISRFNTINTTDKAFKCSKDFFTVMNMARTIFTQTQGAWDGTVDPLVNLWGFGRSGTRFEIPAADKIKTKLAQVGFDQIVFLPNQTIKKRHPLIKIDLASIAKGYGVDQVATLLRKDQMTDFIVEIGGEVYAAGRRKDGRKWRVGINKPDKNAALDAIHAVVEIEGKSFATSGDYRNFIEINGKKYSHIIDPRSGRPVENGVVSVSILADNCALADGLATAVMVLGSKEGTDLINRLDDVEGLIIVAKSDGGLEEHSSNGFQAYRPQD